MNELKASYSSGQYSFDNRNPNLYLSFIIAFVETDFYSGVTISLPASAVQFDVSYKLKLQ